MLIPQLISQLVAAARKHDVDYLDPEKTLALGLCRMGAEPAAGDGESGARRGELIVAGTLSELLACSSPGAAQKQADEEALEEFELQNPAASEAELDRLRDARAVQRALAFWGEPLHSLILVGRRLHPLEVEYGKAYTLPQSRWETVARDVYRCRE